MASARHADPHTLLYKKRGRPSSLPPATTLADLRAHRQVTLADIQRQTGINVAVWSQLERGLIAPQPKHLAALAVVFGVPVGSWRVRFVLETEAVAT